MPKKFHIHAEHAPPRVSPIGKLGIVEWREDCARCHNCVKKACVYGLYRDEADALREDIGYLDYIYHCKGCLTCIQNCTKGILTRVVNPEYLRLGDAYFSPDMVLATWFQAETGRIPVSGAGYRGPFSGTGFDSMWTDMSEIVRPTRDGIHGREYISTSVDIGRKPSHLNFDENGLRDPFPPLVEIPLPVLFEKVPQRWHHGPILEAVSRAAAQIGLFSIVPLQSIPPGLSIAKDNIIPLLPEELSRRQSPVASARIVMLPDRPNVGDTIRALKGENPDQVVLIRLEASAGAAKRTLELTRGGAEGIHLVFDCHGRESRSEDARHVRDVLREVHGFLVSEGVRDETTVIASGGIIEAEHMAKAIICGADLVAIDTPLVVALECRLCLECERDEPCPVTLSEIDTGFAIRRITNLMAAWHQQVIEMLGAMGLREIRRLRGETGRCMFFEDLEKETFGRLFGERQKDN